VGLLSRLPKEYTNLEGRYLVDMCCDNMQFIWEPDGEGQALVCSSCGARWQLDESRPLQRDVEDGELLANLMPGNGIPGTN